MHRLWIVIGSLAGFGAVALSAATTHAFARRLDPPALSMLRNSVEMQGWHALALLACGIWAERRGGLAHLAGAAFLLGLLLFCGAIDLRVFGYPALLRAAPIGGSLLMLGWLLLACAALRR